MLKMSSITEKHTAVIAIVDPETKTPTGATITIAGPEHPKSKAIEFAEARRIRRAVEKAGRFVLDDPEVEANRLVDQLVACTLDWSGFADDDGKEMPCTAENVRTWYVGVPWLRRQVIEARRETANFISRSAGDSSSTDEPLSA